MYLRYLIIVLICAAFSSAANAQVSVSQPSDVLQQSNATVDASIGEERVFADRVTLEQAVRQVRKQYGGRIVSAETRGSGGSRTHVIKVLTEKGRVVTVRIPAN